MSDSNVPPNPFDFLKSMQAMWAANPTPMPGFVAPTMDADELAKRITDLKAVEGWLKINLNTLQMTIQGLEVQQATLAALRNMPASMAEAVAKATEAAEKSKKK